MTEPIKHVCSFCGVDTEPRPAFRFTAAEMIFKSLAGKDETFRSVGDILEVARRYDACRENIKRQIPEHIDAGDFATAVMLVRKMEYLKEVYSRFCFRRLDSEPSKTEG